MLKVVHYVAISSGYAHAEATEENILNVMDIILDSLRYFIEVSKPISSNVIKREEKVCLYPAK